MAEPVTVLSLGAGVQSSVLALMAAKGELPMPAFAVFADTQAEPVSVYRWLDWLEPQLPFPVFRTTKGDLGEAATRVRTSKAGRQYTKHSIPAFAVADGRKPAPMPRQCTVDFKVEAIRREIRLHVPRGTAVRQWIGISTDEAIRVKPSIVAWIENVYPLLDFGMSRQDCLAWASKNGYPEPPRSSCVFCPYHSDEEWLRLKCEEPEGFARAVEFEERYRLSMAKTPMRASVYLHRSGQPLGRIDFGTVSRERIPNQRGNECSGMCGV